MVAVEVAAAAYEVPEAAEQLDLAYAMACCGRYNCLYDAEAAAGAVAAAVVASNTAGVAVVGGTDVMLSLLWTRPVSSAAVVAVDSAEED